ncbi:MAG: heavy metal-binding domain-containing protein [Elusimicrobiota bacterium]
MKITRMLTGFAFAGALLLSACSGEPQAPSTHDHKSAQASATYFCPMPECGVSGKERPGKCPKCGMFLAAKKADGSKATYHCPMPKCGVNGKTQPGKCPKCGMFLIAEPGE